MTEQKNIKRTPDNQKQGDQNRPDKGNNPNKPQPRQNEETAPRRIEDNNEEG